MFPVRLQVEAAFVEDSPQRRLREATDRAEIPVLDLLPIMRDAHARGEGPLFFDHCHHTRRGSALFASPIHRFIRLQGGDHQPGDRPSRLAP